MTSPCFEMFLTEMLCSLQKNMHYFGGWHDLTFFVRGVQYVTRVRMSENMLDNNTYRRMGMDTQKYVASNLLVIPFLISLTLSRRSWWAKEAAGTQRRLQLRCCHLKGTPQQIPPTDPNGGSRGGAHARCPDISTIGKSIGQRLSIQPRMEKTCGEKSPITKP